MAEGRIVVKGPGDVHSVIPFERGGSDRIIVPEIDGVRVSVAFTIFHKGFQEVETPPVDVTYILTSGELEIHCGGTSYLLEKGGVAHIQGSLKCEIRVAVEFASAWVIQSPTDTTDVPCTK